MESGVRRRTLAWFPTLVSWHEAVKRCRARGWFQKGVGPVIVFHPIRSALIMQEPPGGHSFGRAIRYILGTKYRIGHYLDEITVMPCVQMSVVIAGQLGRRVGYVRHPSSVRTGSPSH